MPKIFLTIFAAAFLFLTANAQEFVKMNSGSLSPLYDIVFTNAKNGFAVGGSGTLLHTENGGENWKTVNVPSRDNLKKILFADARKGWILCEKARYSSRGDESLAYLLGTEDGGKSWTRIEIGDTANVVFTNIFLNKKKEILAVGEGGKIFHQTENGWNQLVNQSRYLLLDGIFQNARRGFVIGGRNTVLRTDDGGKTWLKTELKNGDDEPFKLNAIDVSGEKNALIVGVNGRIFGTNNGGTTWTARKSAVENDFYDVKFLTASRALAIGSDGIILATSDNGNIWRKVSSPVTHSLNRIFVSGKNIYIVGFGGVILRGTI